MSKLDASQLMQREAPEGRRSGTGPGIKADAHTGVSGRHLALIQTMRGWVVGAAGLSTPLDQSGVSHTSQPGYLPFSEVQRVDKMKESSHLIKGKRKNAMGTKPTKRDWREPGYPRLLH